MPSTTMTMAHGPQHSTPHTIIAPRMPQGRHKNSSNCSSPLPCGGPKLLQPHIAVQAILRTAVSALMTQ